MVRKSVKIPDSIKKNPMIPKGMSYITPYKPGDGRITSTIPRAGKYSLQHNSSTNVRVGKCKYCPIRSDCPDRNKHSNSLPHGKKTSGCNQLRSLFIYHMKGLTKFEEYLMTEISYLQSKIGLQEIRDHNSELVFSPEYMEAHKLLIVYLDRLDRFKTRKESNPSGRGMMDTDAIDIEFIEKEKDDVKEGDMYIPEPVDNPDKIESKDLPPSMQPQQPLSPEVKPEKKEPIPDEVKKILPAKHSYGLDEQ